MIEPAEHISQTSALLQDPTFWVAVAFVGFCAAFGRKLYRALIVALDARSAKISVDLEEARRLREEAEAVLATYRSKYDASIKEAEGILARAREEATSMLRRAEDEMKAMVTARTKMAHEKIALAEKQAVQEVQDHVVDITITAAKTLIMENLSQMTGDELVRMAIADIERKVH